MSEIIIVFDPLVYEHLKCYNCSCSTASFAFHWPKLLLLFLSKKKKFTHRQFWWKQSPSVTMSLAITAFCYHLQWDENKKEEHFFCSLDERINFPRLLYQQHHRQPNTFLLMLRKVYDGLYNFAPGSHRTNRFTGFMGTLMMQSTLWSFVCLPVLLLSAVWRREHQQRMILSIWKSLKKFVHPYCCHM